MQIGIDVGATKIETVLLEEDGNEKHRSRTDCHNRQCAGGGVQP